MASSEEISKKVDLTTCSICFETFKTPKYFPCLHSFCEGCIKTYIATTIVRTKDGVNCPICRMFVSKPKDISVEEWSTKLPTNHILVSLIDMNDSKSGQKLCTACARENETESACTWCINCAESLCKSCERYHRRNKFLSNHKLVDIERCDIQNLPLQHAETLCAEHPDEIVKAYCSDHSVVCCMTCIMLKHRKCEHVGSINEAVEEKKKSKEIELFPDALKEVKTSLDAMLDYTTENLQRLDKDVQSVKSEVDTLFSKLSDHLQKLKSDILSELSKIEKDVKPELQEKQDELKCKSSTVENDLALFQTNMKYAPPAHFLKAMEKLMEQKVKLEQFVKEGSQQLEEIRVTFAASETLLKIKNDVQEFGNVNIRRTRKDNMLQSVDRHVNMSTVVPTLSSTIDVSAEVTGIAILDNCAILISLFGNQTLELRDHQCSSVLSSLSLPGRPWGFKMTSDIEGAVVVNYHGLVFFKIQNNKITKINEIEANTKNDFVYNQGFYYVGTYKNITIYDSNHSKVREISVDKPAGCMALRDNSSLCYTVWGGRELYCITMDGTPVFTYSHDKLQNTIGVTVDHAGYIFVCGKMSSNVHQLSHDGKLERIIFVNLPFPYCVSFNKRGDKAVIGCKKNVFLYDLT